MWRGAAHCHFCAGTQACVAQLSRSGVFLDRAYLAAVYNSLLSAGTPQRLFILATAARLIRCSASDVQELVTFFQKMGKPLRAPVPFPHLPRPHRWSLHAHCQPMVQSSTPGDSLALSMNIQYSELFTADFTPPQPASYYRSIDSNSLFTDGQRMANMTDGAYVLRTSSPHNSCRNLISPVLRVGTATVTTRPVDRMVPLATLPHRSVCRAPGIHTNRSVDPQWRLG